MLKNLPTSIENVFTTHKTPEAIFSALMPTLGEFLKCDRCFLYLRNPETGLGKVPFFWIRNSTIPKIYDENWKPEPDYLSSEDPMFAAALRTEPSIFMDDVNTTDVEILNQEFEKRIFGHRALIHAHLCQDEQLWGILQPCIYQYARNWTQKERQVMDQVTQIITPIAVEYVVAAKQK